MMPRTTYKNWNDCIIFCYKKNLEIKFQNGREHETTFFKKSFSVRLSWKNSFSILQFCFHQINKYDLEEWEGESRKIILQKYRFYNPCSRSGKPKKWKIRHFNIKQIRFAQLLITIQKKILLGFIVWVVSHTLGATFFSFKYKLVFWEMWKTWCHI